MNRLAPCLIILLLVPAVAADVSATAQGFTAAGHTVSTGHVAGLSINGLNAPTIMDITIHAQQGYALRWTETGVAAPAVAGLQFGNSLHREGERLPKAGMVDDVVLTGGAHDLAHFLNVIPRDDATFGYASQPGAEAELRIRHAPTDLCLGRAGLAKTSPCEGYDERRSSAMDVRLPAPSQYVEAAGPGTVNVTANMLVLDIGHIDLAGTFDLPGRTTTTTGADYEAFFTRLVLIGASVSITFDGGHDQVAWMAQDMVMDTDGMVTFDGAHGTMGVDGEELSLGDGSTIAGPVHIASAANDGALGLDFDDDSQTAASDAIAPMLGRTGFAWSLAALLLALPLAVVLITVRRSQPRVTMRDVEAALSARRFQRAARLARRVIRYDPFHESAHLGRAIALTKSGRPGRAVACLDAFLERHQPADGTLQYALGVALFDLGRPDDARAAMSRAVEKTPALLGEMPGGRTNYEGGAYS